MLLFNLYKTMFEIPVLSFFLFRSKELRAVNQWAQTILLCNKILLNMEILIFKETSVMGFDKNLSWLTK